MKQSSNERLKRRGNLRRSEIKSLVVLIMADESSSIPSIDIEFHEAELIEEDDSKILNGMLGITFAFSVAFLILATSLGELATDQNSPMSEFFSRIKFSGYCTT